jgi:hypothetical protein
MQHGHNYSTIYLVGRSLLPSLASASWGAVFSICLAVVHMVLFSLNIGTSLPSVLDGEWSVAYTNAVVQPLATLVNNLVFNNVLILILWGVAGLATYFLIEYVVYLRREWRSAEDDIQLAENLRVIHHPARKSFFTTVLWRMGVLVAGAVAFVAIQPVLQYLLRADQEVVRGALSFQASMVRLALILVGWTFLTHCVVVFLRLFLMRTRIFGDPSIE